MFQLNEDMSIYLTRGDAVFFDVGVKNASGEDYVFKVSDVIRFKVYEKKAPENVVLQKDFAAEVDSEAVTVFLSEADTKIGEVISKPADYWYEVELNPNTEPQTVIGYDEDGAKIFRLFPEGADVPPYTPTPEEIPVIDDELDAASERPIQNGAVARAIAAINTYLAGLLENIREGFASIRGEISNVREQCLAGEHSAVKMQGLIDTSIAAHKTEADKAYAAKGHNHDEAYAKADHKHTASEVGATKKISYKIENITANAWVSDGTDGWYCERGVADIKTSDNAVFAYPIIPDDATKADYALIRGEWNHISRIWVNETNKIRFEAHEVKPTETLNIRILVVR